MVLIVVFLLIGLVLVLGLVAEEVESQIGQPGFPADRRKDQGRRA